MIKLAFTTLGCPEWNMEQIVSRAVDYGFDGVDFRGYKGQMSIYEMPEFSSEIKKTLKQFEDAGLEVACFSSSVHLFSQENFEKNMHEIREYARLCQFFNTKYIRVFGGKIGDVERTLAIHTVIRHLESMGQIAKDHNVKLVLETHDDWTACQDVRAVMEQADRDGVAVLWDVHHPYRTIGEQPLETWNTLGRWIEYTHWKDSFVSKENKNGFQYCLMGEGDIPLRDIYSVFKKNNYSGWFTLEWEKKWHPEIEEPEIAFPQYVQFMRKLIEEGVQS